MAAPEMITVVARWRIQSEHVDEVLAHVAELRLASLAEPGCLSYEAFRSVDAADTVLLLERYRDAAAVESHRLSDHYRQRLVQHILPLLLERQVDLLQAPRSA